VPPTATRVPPTATPVPVIQPPLASADTPTATPTPPPEDASGGGCGTSFGSTTVVEGMGNLLMLFGPLLGLVAMRTRLRNRR
ncbi:MAG: hypothetical protein QF878_06315, partial [SAR202 cluster bacterium]|nr:hypothetical protein [SAR202 cluster bacterium]